ncbi:18302_t:CDS:2, partial [Gigaspora rosea]
VLFNNPCDYYKMLQSVDKEKKFKKEEKLGQLNKKGSLMRFKKLFRTLKLDYDIFFWIKSFNDTETTIYKDETKLLKDFKQYVFRKGNKKDKKVAKDVDALQTIHLNEDKNLLKTDNEIEFPKPENNPPEQYKSKEWNI